jgi:glycosyltransferase involved in cell wall biosynthesis
MTKLFIYLPTYNRPASLRAQLMALLPQVKDFPEDVRLLVCDNASSKYCEEEVFRGHSVPSNVEIRRNGGNIGGNANIALGFVFARPDEFLWILSDNDIVSPNAVRYLLSVLDPSIDFYCFVNGAESEKDVWHDWNAGWQIPMEWRMGLISDALYNMATVRDVVEEAFYFHNSSFPHLAVACAAARKKGATRFRLLPRERISSDEASSMEQPTDYSLARVCMPLLVPLFPKWEARSFCRKWLWSHGIMLHVNKSLHPHLYIQSKATLRHYGGGLAVALLWGTGIAAFILKPYLRRRAIIVQKSKLFFSDSALESIKRIRAKLFARKS